MSNKIKIVIAAITTIAAIMALVFISSSFTEYRFSGSKEVVLQCHSPEELERAEAFSNALLEASSLQYSVTPIDYYVDAWMDGGYTAKLRILVGDGDSTKVIEFDLDNLLATNYVAYVHGMSDLIPTDLLVEDSFGIFTGNISIQESDPSYSHFQGFNSDTVYCETGFTGCQ